MAREELSKSEVEALINELEQKMQRLRALYEQYFMGIERIPPTTARKDVVRLIRRLEQVTLRNTALKFKIRSLVQRFNSYKSYWNRVERQIEEGTYERDVRRAKRNQTRQERKEERDDEYAIDLEDFELDDIGLDDLQAELDDLDKKGEFEKYVGTAKVPDGVQRRQAEADREREMLKQKRLDEIQSQLGIGDGRGESSGGDSGFAERKKGELPTSGASMTKIQKLAKMKEKLERQQREQGRRPAGDRSRRQIVRNERSGTSSSGASSSGSSAGGSDDRRERQVYEKLLEAKKRCNESTSGLSYEQVSKSMRAQRDQLRKKRGAKDVDFQVVIKNGRAFLKPVPK